MSPDASIRLAACRKQARENLTPDQKAEAALRREQARERARIKLENLAPVLAAAGGSFDPLVDLQTATAYLGFGHEQTVRKLVATKEIACVRNGNRGWLKFRLSALNAFLRRREKRATRRSEA